MSQRHWTHRATLRLIRWVVHTVAVLIAIFATFVLVQAFASRRMADLESWHRDIPQGEFRAADLDDGFTFAQYRDLEDRLFESLARYDVQAGDGSNYSSLLRYVRDGRQNPAHQKQNWNRSFELVPDKIRGGVLLVHGLSDSPYSMRAVAEVFSNHGYYVLAMRMPGHGTVPAGLLDCSWRDWVAAVEVGARHVQEKIGANLPFCVGGYSNGGALVVHHTLETLEGTKGRVPDRVFLFSPAIGITKFARVARWDKLYAFIPYFEKSRWLSILPEYDPYKYNSFPKQGGALEWEMTGAVHKRLRELDETGRMGEFPPVLTFQSAVDATVLVSELVTQLYDRVETEGSELVLFDVNRMGRTHELISPQHAGATDRLVQGAPSGYRLTIVGNVTADTTRLKASSRAPRSATFDDETLDLEWPRHVYSLAHVAIPFRPDDALYGLAPEGSEEYGVAIGKLAPRGERDVLTIPAAMLARIRCNPFFDYIARRIGDSLAVGDGAAPPKPEDK